MRTFLRIIGPIMVVVGGFFMIAGLADFFMSFNNFGMPTKFWYLFIGLPTLGLGINAVRLGYLKPISNYLENETHDAVGKLAKNIGSNLNIQKATKTDIKVRCPSCRNLNDEKDRFCSSCGSSLQ